MFSPPITYQINYWCSTPVFYSFSSQRYQKFSRKSEENGSIGIGHVLSSCYIEAGNCWQYRVGYTGPVLKVGAHVRGTKESWGDQIAGWLFLYLISVKLAGLFSNKCIRTELEYMQLWREVIEHRSRASVVYLISNWGWKHKLRIFVACWMCRKLRAF